MHETPLILIADDEAHILHVVGLKLGNAGYEVVAAEDGAEALALVRKRRPNLVITDLQMPNLTGLELCVAMRGDAATADTPAILLTARGSSVEPRELALTNIREVMSKPFSPRDLLGKVEALTGREEQEAAT